MALLKFRQQKPPGGFTYLQRETRLRMEGDNLPELVKKVIEHRIYKNLPDTDPEKVQLEIERQICSRLTEHECKSEGGEDEWLPVDVHGAILSPKTVLRASRAAMAWLGSGGAHVAREQAQNRRETCLSCPMNTPLTGCKCGTVYQALNLSLPKEKKFPDLGVCAACSCSLQLKVWLPKNVIDESNNGENFPFPSFCWQTQENG